MSSDFAHSFVTKDSGPNADALLEYKIYKD